MNLPLLLYKGAIIIFLYYGLNTSIVVHKDTALTLGILLFLPVLVVFIIRAGGE